MEKKWCILKCILIKFQGKNSLKISLFIATTPKKATSKERKGACSHGKENFEKMVHFKMCFN